MLTLDDLMPNPRHRMRHQRTVHAPPAVVWDELHQVTMSALPMSLALEAIRLLPARIAGRSVPALAQSSFLDVAPIPVLLSDRPRTVISAGLSQAWRLLGGATPPELDAAELRSWTKPGWIKVGMDFRLETVPDGTLLRTETRIIPTDPKTGRAFATYWFLIRPGSAAIRRELLRTVAGRAAASARRGRETG
jgi:hypothetical protein